MDTKELYTLIDQHKQELYELLCKLIKINSESFGNYGNEEECARYIHSICHEIGLESDLFSPLDIECFEQHPDYMPGRGLDNRYNVVARWKGEQDTNELMLMAHTDTVQLGDINNWERNPLSGEIDNGKIYGRGASDDKYAIATALFVIKLLKDAGFKPKSNLLFAAYSDEEYGGSHGAMSAVMKYPCKRIVSMDGVEGEIWHCGSGGGEVKYKFHTKNTVDSAKITAQAIPIILDVMENFANNRYNELEENRFYKGTEVPKASLRYMGIRAGNDGCDLGEGEIYFVYYTDKTKSEINTEFSELEELLTSKLSPLGIVGDGFKPCTRFFHYVFCEPDSEDIKIMCEASKEATGKEPQIRASCLSDLSVISKYGSSRAFGFGAGREFNLIGGAHQPNEFIECSALLNYAKTIATYILKVLG